MGNGLFCHRNGLSGVAVKLSQDQQDNLEETIASYVGKHKENQYVVVLEIPSLPSELKSLLNKINGELALDITIDGLLVEELPEAKKTSRYGYFLPSKYVKSYFNGESKRFTNNPQLNPFLTETDQIRIGNVLKNITPDDYYAFMES